MNTVEFLREMLPHEGHICLCYPIPGLAATGGQVPMVNAPYSDFKLASAKAVEMAQSVDVYFALFTYPETFEKASGNGSTYKRIRRTQANAGLTRLLWADLDVGTSTDADLKYDTQRDAIIAICAFCDEIGLPHPTLVNSGYGVHCYWRFTRNLTRAEWQVIADLFKKVLIFKGVRFDRKVTTDAARVLRIPGTWNHKRAEKVRVKCKGLTDAVDPDEVRAILLAVEATMPIQEVAEVVDWVAEDLPTPKALRSVCPTFNRMAADAPSATEGVWWGTLQLVRHTTGGEKLGHALSALHPDYQREETQAKLDRMAEIKLGPPTCGTLEGLYSPSPCATCPNYGLFKSSPVVFARRLAETPLPDDVPPPERPYLRTKRGVEWQAITGPDEPPAPAVVIYGYDFFPRRIVNDPVRKVKAVEWTAVKPIEGEVTFMLPADVYADENKMISILVNNGVTVDKHHAKRMGGYMSHYIKQLQALRPEEHQHSTFGWVEGSDHTKFLIGTTLITAEGTSKAAITPGAANAAHSMTQGGTLAGQIAAQEFYNHDEYLPQQFFAMCALGAPLLYMTRHHGVAVNMSGPSGASKSSSMALGGGYYGDPQKFVQNGTASGMTQKARMSRLETLANLPLLLDEATNMPADAVKEMVLAVTQPGRRIGMRSDQTEIEVPDSLKSTMMLTTSNNSMHSLLALNNAAGSAGSMRVVEPVVDYTNVHTKAQADQYLIAIQDNFGWIGPLFIRHVIRNPVAVAAALAAITADLEERGQIRPPERFWAATICIAVLACAIAAAKGWVPYDPDKLMDWAIDVQLPRMRRVVSDAYLTPVGVLQAFLAEVANNILVVQPQQGMREMIPLSLPRGELIGRYEPEVDVAWVTSYAFRRFCDRQKLNFDATMKHLVDHGIATFAKMNLGKGVPSISSTAGRCLQLDMAHTELSGLPPIETDAGAQIIQFPAAALASGKRT